jgi:hypothetical protein
MKRGRIFINYRRDDSRADSGRLYDRLASRFPGNVFRDVASLEPGVEWHDAIARVLSQTDACIVVIGKDWATIADANGRRRLDDPRDTVRQEVVTALERKMRVFPVLVGGAKMPAEEELPADLQALCRRNALELTEQDWDEDFAKLLKALETSLGLRSAQPAGSARSAGAKWVLAAMGGVGALILLAGYVASNRLPSPRSDNQTVITPRSSDATNPAADAGSSNAGNARYASAAPPETPLRGSATFAGSPRRPALNATHFVGNWEAAVGANGQTLDEQVEIYPDNSFRVMLRGAAAAVGRWRYDSATESLEVTDAVNFLNNGLKFTCVWRNTSGEEFGGGCVDRLQNSWGVTLTRGAGPLPAADYDVPRSDVSVLTLAERAAFVQVLAAMRCTCPCGLTVLLCLQKDQTCTFSPNLAKNALANFLRLTRSS